VLATRVPIHTHKDDVAPALRRITPDYGAVAACDPSWTGTGCQVEFVFEFHEDVLLQNQSRNVYISCQTFACGDAYTIDVSSPTWVYGTTHVNGRFLYVSFTTYGLLHDRLWTVTFDGGIVADKWGNACNAFSDANYTFTTPLAR
jgi:hypothetical protein